MICFFRASRSSWIYSICSIHKNTTSYRQNSKYWIFEFKEISNTAYSAWEENSINRKMVWILSSYEILFSSRWFSKNHFSRRSAQLDLKDYTVERRESVSQTSDTTKSSQKITVDMFPTQKEESHINRRNGRPKSAKETSSLSSRPQD